MKNKALFFAAQKDIKKQLKEFKRSTLLVQDITDEVWFEKYWVTDVKNVASILLFETRKLTALEEVAVFKYKLKVD